MNRILLVGLGLCSALACAAGEIIAQWNFNSPAPDGNIATGTLSTSVGSGSAALIGGATASYATGSTNDPAPADNSGWNTSSYPAQGTKNKTAGAQFNVSTAGYSNVQIWWDHRVSGTASKYCRLQYSSDGTTFYDSRAPIAATAVASAPTYFEAVAIDLDSSPPVNDNPNFAFRIVVEFESTAMGAGVEGYVTTYGTNQYSRAGTIRFDMVTVWGTAIPSANTPPFISPFENLVLRVNQFSDPLPFSVRDSEDVSENLRVEASCSNPAVVPSANLVVAGLGMNRTLTLHAGSTSGTCNVTIRVYDTAGKSCSTTFLVTVLPLNTAPFISFLLRTNCLANSAVGPIPFLVGDLETSPDNLTVYATSGNPTLVPNSPENLLVSAGSSNRTLTVTPTPGVTGVAPITVTVSDGTYRTGAAFPLAVTPSANVLLYEPFSYSNGSVTTNSAFLWERRSGIYGQCQVMNGQLGLTSGQTEDVVTALLAGPYVVGKNARLYASFKVRFLTLPKVAPGCFAHFADGSVLRGRVFAGTTNAAPGRFRLFIANGSDTNIQATADLPTQISYTVVIRYDVDKALATLWVNPQAESDAGVMATDTQPAMPINSFGFRQDTDIGASLLVDDLRIGLSFYAVLPSAPPKATELAISRNGDQVILIWSNVGLVLQTASAAEGPFTTVPGALSPSTNHIAGTCKFYRLGQN